MKRTLEDNYADLKNQAGKGRKVETLILREINPFYLEVEKVVENSSKVDSLTCEIDKLEFN